MSSPNTLIVSISSALDWAEHNPRLATSLWILAYILYKALDFLIFSPLSSPLDDLPGPPKPGKVFDLTDLQNTMDTMKSHQKQQEMREQYGKNVRIQGFGYWDQRLLTFDTTAINYILSQATESYPKPWQSRRLLARLLGEGVAFTEGEQHKRQRKVISPAFAPAALKRRYPIFHAKAAELRDRWLGLIDHPTTPSPIIDIHHWLGRATFDTFASAGFDYHLSCIQHEDHPLYMAYKQMFEMTINRGQTLRGFLEIYMPWLDWVLPDAAARQVKKSKEVIKKAGEDLIKIKKEAILREVSGLVDEEKDGGVAASEQKDILSLLIKSNLAESHRISDAELLAQIHSFLFVGSDSVSLAIVWALHNLSHNLALQARLRAELAPHAPFTSPSARDVSIFPLLDTVMKETLRLCSPVQGTLRVAAKEDIIPTQDGKGVRIRKGEMVHIPYEGMNLAKDIWGQDAWEFRPERWFNLPNEARRLPGLMTGLISFSVGSHSCPGAQFAIMEAKAFLACLLTSFEFLPVPEKSVAKINMIVTRPYVVGDWSKGAQLPMIIKPLASAVTDP